MAISRFEEAYEWMDDREGSFLQLAELSYLGYVGEMGADMEHHLRLKGKNLRPDTVDAILTDLRIVDDLVLYYQVDKLFDNSF